MSASAAQRAAFARRRAVIAADPDCETALMAERLGISAGQVQTIRKQLGLEPPRAMVLRRTKRERLRGRAEVPHA